jgi:hypothetical protein
MGRLWRVRPGRSRTVVRLARHVPGVSSSWMLTPVRRSPRIQGADPADPGPEPGLRHIEAEVDRDMSLEATSAHIVTIRRQGVIEGYQLRINGGGPGLSKFFAARKLGGTDKALRAARRTAREMNLPKTRKRGGSVPGRLLSTSRTPAAGIRFEWTRFALSTVLYVVATWRGKKGRPSSTRYSVDRHGIEDALDLALSKRTSCGAPMPDRVALLKALRKVYKAGPEAAD